MGAPPKPSSDLVAVSVDGRGAAWLEGRFYGDSDVVETAELAAACESGVAWERGLLFTAGNTSPASALGALLAYAPARTILVQAPAWLESNLRRGVADDTDRKFVTGALPEHEARRAALRVARHAASRTSARTPLAAPSRSAPEGPSRPAELRRQIEDLQPVFRPVLLARAARRFTQKHGVTPEQALVAVGALVAERAEERAGLSLDRIRIEGAAVTADARAELKGLADRSGLAYYVEQIGVVGAQLAKHEHQQAWPIHPRTQQLRDTLARHRAKRCETLSQTRGLEAAIIEWGDAQDGRAPTVTTSLARLRDAYRSVLEDLRPMGGDLNLHPESEAAAVESFAAAAQFYPRSWLRRSNRSHLPVARVDATRGRYIEDKKRESALDDIRATRLFTAPEQRALLPGLSAMEATSLHELGHRMEHVVPGLRLMARAHLVRRTTRADGTREPLEDPLHNGESVFLSSTFATYYQGRDYAYIGDSRPRLTFHPKGTEIVSIGMQSLFGGTHSGFSGAGSSRQDVESRNFILGLLATIP